MLVTKKNKLRYKVKSFRSSPTPQTNLDWRL